MNEIINKVKEIESLVNQFISAISDLDVKIDQKIKRDKRLIDITHLIKILSQVEKSRISSTQKLSDHDINTLVQKSMIENREYIDLDNERKLLQERNDLFSSYLDQLEKLKVEIKERFESLKSTLHQ